MRGPVDQTQDEHPQVFFHDLSTFHLNTYSSVAASYLKPFSPWSRAGSLASDGGVLPHG